MGRMCPLPSRLEGLGSIVSSPSGVRSGAPAENRFWCILNLKESLWWQKLVGTSYLCGKFFKILQAVMPKENCPNSTACVNNTANSIFVVVLGVVMDSWCDAVNSLLTYKLSVVSIQMHATYARPCVRKSTQETQLTQENYISEKQKYATQANGPCVTKHSNRTGPVFHAMNASGSQ